MLQQGLLIYENFVESLIIRDESSIAEYVLTIKMITCQINKINTKVKNISAKLRIFF